MTGHDAPAGLLVHGMGKDPVEPDWAPLTEGEAGAILARYGEPSTGPGGEHAEITWWSPRPMSAAALVHGPATRVFVKRHDLRVRTAAQLAAEHAFAAHLRGRGLTVPAVRRTLDGATTVTSGQVVYEVHEVAAGVDLYRDSVSWSPYGSLGHARAAGAALARLHLAAAGFEHPARPPGVLISSCGVVTAADPLARVAELLRQRPGLGGYLGRRPWADDLAPHVLPLIGRAAPLLRGLPRRWGHGDWHPSNLTWTSPAPDAGVVAVFDFGLANQTYAVHDLAVAIERSAVAWLDLADSGQAGIDLPAVDALLDGYQAVRPLPAAEAAALPRVLAVAHVEYALSEVEYFASVLRSPELADLAYDSYLLDHARWFASPAGEALLAHLGQRAPRSS
jgi:Ser/Thr protein kinase RdoA (MazF antagonist)